mmetsp:Transcript_5326/g.15518  ORF Transcript_5326/g.15518 Transcript_5326/m.15518 type:complete len:226 (-) Transcript_5326:602-1279(-)
MGQGRTVRSCHARGFGRGEQWLDRVEHGARFHGRTQPPGEHVRRTPPGRTVPRQGRSTLHAYRTTLRESRSSLRKDSRRRMDPGGTQRPGSTRRIPGRGCGRTAPVLLYRAHHPSRKARVQGGSRHRRRFLCGPNVPSPRSVRRGRRDQRQRPQGHGGDRVAVRGIHTSELDVESGRTISSIRTRLAGQSDVVVPREKGGRRFRRIATDGVRSVRGGREGAVRDL